MNRTVLTSVVMIFISAMIAAPLYAQATKPTPKSTRKPTAKYVSLGKLLAQLGYGGYVLSPDHRRVAYQTANGILVIDGQERKLPKPHFYKLTLHNKSWWWEDDSSLIVDGVERSMPGLPFILASKTLYLFNGHRHAYVSIPDEKKALKVNFNIGSMYLSRQDGGITLIVDGTPAYVTKESESIVFPTRMAFQRDFSSDEKTFAFWVFTHDPNSFKIVRARIFVDSPSGRKEFSVEGPVTRLMNNNLRVSNGGKYVAFTFDGKTLYLNGTPALTGADQMSDVTFSEDGEHWSVAVRRGLKWYVIVDGKEHPVEEGEVADAPLLGPKGSPWAYVNRRFGSVNGQTIDRLVIDGKPRPDHPEHPNVPKVAISPDSRRVAYVSHSPYGSWTIVLDGKPLAIETPLKTLTSDQILSFGFTPDSRHMVCLTPFELIVDNHVVPLQDEPIGPHKFPPLAFSSPTLFHYVTFKGNEFFRVEFDLSGL